MVVGDVVGVDSEVEVAEAEEISEVVEGVNTEVAETSEASTVVEVEGAVGVVVLGNKEGM